MRIGFIHFHLKPGGVTSVIKQQVAQCHSLGYRSVVLCGENPLGLPETLILEDLKYEVDQPKDYLAPEPQILARDIMAAFRIGFHGQDVDLIHVHNPLLRKNDILLPSLKILADQGIPVLFHIHDPSEDGRPDMVHPATYPTNGHYAFLNSRDRNNFIAAGIPQDYAHLLPNEVSSLPGSEHSLAPSEIFQPKLQGYLTYPVRAIPRKNLGEAVALGVLLEDVGIAITLPPNNPQDLPGYKRLVDLTQHLGAPVVFEAGINHDFAALLAGSLGTITTSVKEGFGFTFLEPWTIGKPVFGRYLPGVCGDFEAQGVNLKGLYSGFPIPLGLGLFSLDRFKNRWIEAWNRQLVMISRSLGFLDSDKGLTNQINDPNRRRTLLQQEFSDLFTLGERGESVDFSFLDPESQFDVLLALKDSHNRALLKKANPQFELLKVQLSGSDSLTQQILENQRIVNQVYGSGPASQRLEKIYQRVLAAPPLQYKIDREQLIGKYLLPLRKPAWGPVADLES